MSERDGRGEARTQGARVSNEIPVRPRTKHRAVQLAPTAQVFIVRRALINVNGRKEELAPGETVATLLARLGLEAGWALVERNGEPVERARYAEIELQDADRLVVARPVAGG